MKIEVHIATKGQLNVVSEMSRLFRYDVSEFKGMPCPEDGIYEPIPDINKYWQKINYPFIIRCQNELAGFALIEGRNQPDVIDFYFAHLFVLRKFRRTGIGKIATIQIFENLQGRWQVNNNVPNIPAVKYWDNIITEYTNGNYTSTEELHEKWGKLNIIRFSNKIENDT